VGAAGHKKTRINELLTRDALLSTQVAILPYSAGKDIVL